MHFPPQTLHVLFRIFFLQTNAIIVVSDILFMIFTNNLEYFLVRKVSFIHLHRGLCAILDLFDEFSFLSSSWRKSLNLNSESTWIFFSTMSSRGPVNEN